MSNINYLLTNLLVATPMRLSNGTVVRVQPGTVAGFCNCNISTTSLASVAITVITSAHVSRPNTHDTRS